MKGLETGHNKIKKICDVLKKETLEPAELKAQALIEEAKREAEEIISQAHQRSEQMQLESQLEMQKQKLAFEASLAQACRQTTESLKEKIETQFFHPQLFALIEAPLKDPNVIAKLIQSVIRGIEKEGIMGNMEAFIPFGAPIDEVNHLLGKRLLEKLKDKTVLHASLKGGIEVKLTDQHMTLDLSDETFHEMIVSYLRKDFRQFLFGL
ncbi:MAG: V-type ATP synthase subunit E [Candidatus Rhabdochlamydia sp.]